MEPTKKIEWKEHEIVELQRNFRGIPAGAKGTIVHLPSVKNFDEVLVEFDVTTTNTFKQRLHNMVVEVKLKALLFEVYIVSPEFDFKRDDLNGTEFRKAFNNTRKNCFKRFSYKSITDYGIALGGELKSYLKRSKKQRTWNGYTIMFVEI